MDCGRDLCAAECASNDWQFIVREREDCERSDDNDELFFRRHLEISCFYFSSQLRDFLTIGAVFKNVKAIFCRGYTRMKAVYLAKNK